MKKITLFISTIFAAVMLSSCVVIGLDDSPYSYSTNRTTSTTSSSSTTTHTTTNTSNSSRTKHAVTCYNQTSYTITDWCVKKDNQVTFANSTNNRMIVPNAHDTISDLPVGRYQIFFSFDNCYQLQPCNYTGSEEFYLDRDINYILSERSYSYSCKSAVSDYPVFVLQGSDGSEIELYPEE